MRFGVSNHLLTPDLRHGHVIAVPTHPLGAAPAPAAVAAGATLRRRTLTNDGVGGSSIRPDHHHVSVWHSAAHRTTRPIANLDERLATSKQIESRLKRLGKHLLHPRVGGVPDGEPKNLWRWPVLLEQPHEGNDLRRHNGLRATLCVIDLSIRRTSQTERLDRNRHDAKTLRYPVRERR